MNKRVICPYCNSINIIRVKRRKIYKLVYKARLYCCLNCFKMFLKVKFSDNVIRLLSLALFIVLFMGILVVTLLFDLIIY